MRALWNCLCDLNSTQLAVSGAEEGAQRCTATIGQLLHIGRALRMLEGSVPSGGRISAHHPACMYMYAYGGSSVPLHSLSSFSMQALRCGLLRVISIITNQEILKKYIKQKGYLFLLLKVHLPSLTFLYEKADFFSFSVVFQTIF